MQAYHQILRANSNCMIISSWLFIEHGLPRACQPGFVSLCHQPLALYPWSSSLSLYEPKNPHLRAGEVPLQLKALPALSETWDSTPSTHLGDSQQVHQGCAFKVYFRTVLWSTLFPFIFASWPQGEQFYSTTCSLHHVLPHARFKRTNKFSPPSEFRTSKTLHCVWLFQIFTLMMSSWLTQWMGKMSTLPEPVSTSGKNNDA